MGIPGLAGEAKSILPVGNGPEKSDSPIVPRKWPNKRRLSAEAMEGRGLRRENMPELPRMLDTEPASATPPLVEARERPAEGLERVRLAARKDKNLQFTALFHHITPKLLRESFDKINPKASPGVDGVEHEDLEEDIESYIADLHRRLHIGAIEPSPA